MSKIKRSVALCLLLIASQLIVHILIKHPLSLFEEESFVMSPIPPEQLLIPTSLPMYHSDSLAEFPLAPFPSTPPLPSLIFN